MNLKKEIIAKYGTQAGFAIVHDESPQIVSYWCKKEWERMSYNTKIKIEGYLKKGKK